MGPPWGVPMGTVQCWGMLGGAHLGLKGTAEEWDPMVGLCPKRVGKLRHGVWGGGVKEGLAGGLTHRTAGLQSRGCSGWGAASPWGGGPQPPPGSQLSQQPPPGPRPWDE